MNRLYLSPGMFGFGRLATYDYFAHVERALMRRFADAGKSLEVHVVDVSPTASIRRRAVRLAEIVAKTSDDHEGTIHLLGHSTGAMKDDKYNESDLGPAFPFAQVLPFLERVDFGLSLPTWSEVRQQAQIARAKGNLNRPVAGS